MHYLFLRLVFFFLHFLATQISTVLADVTWDSPSVGDVYIPGDTLQAIWRSSDKVVSPSFTMCTGTNHNGTSATNSTDCGTAVWPSVEQNGTEYSISLAIPNISDGGNYFLVMKDDRGTMYDTPNFSLALANNASDTKTTATSNTSQPASTDITYVPSHSSSAAAAIAIPLSLVAAILLGAFLLLLFRSRRSGQRERDKENQYQISRETESRSRLNDMNFASATDIERAVLGLSTNRGYDSSASFAHKPPPMGVGDSYTGPGPHANTTFGMGPFGWAHGFGATASTAPPVSDAYTPAPVLRHGTYSSTRSISRPRSMYGYHELEKNRGPTNWLESDWRSSQQTFADEIPRYCSGPPQLPAIQIYASSPTVHTDVLHPLPLKQPIPPRLDVNAPRAYTPPYGPSWMSSESSLPQTPGTEVHTSLNVISNYVQASPAPSQLHRFYSNEQASELSAPHILAPSMFPVQLRDLEALPQHEENDKPLPPQPKDSGGMNLYGAVSKAISGWRA